MTSMFELGVPQVVGWYLAAAIVAAAGWVTFGGQHRNPQHDRETAWLAWHWFTGGPLEPIRSYPGAGGRPRRTARRLTLGLARTGLVVGFVAQIYLQSEAHSTALDTVAIWSVGGAAVMAVASVIVTRVAVEWSMFRHYKRPLHYAVADDAGWPIDLSWWRILMYLRVPRGGPGGSEVVTVSCGPTFKRNKDTKDKVVESVTTVLSLSNVQHNWNLEGIHRHVEFLQLAPVPAKVPFKAVKGLIEAESTSSRVLLGMTRGSEPVWLDFDKSPHVLFSAGTGGGKSVALAGPTAQLLWHGAEVVVLDIKRMSHLWLRDLPNVRYSRAIEEIHRSLLDVHAEVERRTRLWDSVTAEQEWAGDIPRFPRLVVLFDEISSTMGRLRHHWADVREPGEPQRSSALRAWDDILNQGRQVHVNVLAAGQRGSANAVGSGDNRENFELVGLIDRYSPKTWKMFTDAPFVPGISHAGRAQLLIGASAIETQMLWLEPRDAWRWVIDKKGSQPRVAHPVDVPLPGETGRDSRASATAPVQAVTLWEASSDKGRGVVSLRYANLRQQRLRHPGEFPEAVGWRGEIPEFDPSDLRRWEKNRTTPLASDGVAGGETNEGDEVDRVDDRENERLAENDTQGAWLHGEPSRRDSDRDRFWAKVAPADEAGCRLWTGPVNGDGYAYFHIGGKAIPAHRLAYEAQVGPIPQGYTIDHLVGPDEPCTSKLCMEGSHLEAVTNEKNVSRRHERDKAAQGATT